MRRLGLGSLSNWLKGIKVFSQSDDRNLIVYNFTPRIGECPLPLNDCGLSANQIQGAVSINNTDPVLITRLTQRQSV